MQIIKRIYDKKNRLIEESDLDDNDIYFKKFKYDDNDNLIFLEKKDLNHYYKTLEYNENKQLIKESFYNIRDGVKEFSYQKDIEYNENGLKQKISILKFNDYYKLFYYNGKIDEYKYDDNNELIEKKILTNVLSDKSALNEKIIKHEKIELDGVNFISYKEINNNYTTLEQLKELDNLNRIIKIFNVDRVGRKTEICSLEYWDDTNVLKKENIFGNIKLFNQDGLLEKITNDNLNNNYDIYKYDNYKNLIKIEYYQKNELINVIQYEYNIDNILLSKKMFDGKQNELNTTIYENEYIISEQELKQELDDYFDFDR